MLWTRSSKIRIVLSVLLFSSSSCSADSKEEVAVSKMLDGYFSSWSSNDMRAYQNCFHPEASIQYINPDMSVTTFAVPEFVAEQGRMQSERKGTERPLSKQIMIEGNHAHAIVRWKLESGGRTVTGFDHFLLLLDSGQWKIIHLSWVLD